MKEGKESVSRRNMLKKIGVGSGSVVALAGSSQARQNRLENLKKLKNKYESKSEVLATIKNQGSGLLQNLAERGFIDDPSVSKLNLGTLLSAEELQANKEGAYVTGTELKGVQTGRITVKKKTSQHHISLFFHPEAEENYAIVKPPRELSVGDEVTIVTDDGLSKDDSSGTVGTQDDTGGGGGSCTYEGTVCNGYDASNCWGTWVEHRYYKCASCDCNKGEVTGCCADEKSPCCGSL